jgi:2-dehydropantoate 2-reductase
MNRSSLGKIAVVGSGAVGCYYGGMLAHAGHDVHFLMRADLDTVRREGLRIFTKGNEAHLPRVQCATNANGAERL